MRLNKISVMLLASTLMMGGFSACSSEDDAISDLKGIFEAPVDIDVTGAALVDKTKSGALRTFTVDFSTAQGEKVHLVLVSNQYYIPTNGYTYASAATAKNGNFTDGSTIDGKAITSGTLSISQNGDDMSISRCSLFAADGQAFRLKGNASLSFEPDDPTALSSIKPVYNWDGTTSDYTNNGDGTITITFTTGGYIQTQNTSTYMMEYAGEGFDFQIVFKTADGKLHPGTYSPGTGYVIGEANLYEAYGAFTGTSWGVIEKGAKTCTYITSGDIVVTKEGPLYSILIDQGKGGVYAQYQGSLGDLDPDGNTGSIVKMSSVLAVNNYAQLNWIGLIDIQLATGDVTSSTDPTTYATTYAGSGDFLQIEVYSEQGVGTLARGTYEIADDSTFGPMKFKAGAVGAYGDGGTFVKTVADGNLGEATFFTEGTLNIEGEGDSTSITLSVVDANGEKVTYMFTGNIGL